MGRIPILDEPQNALKLIRPRHREIMRRLVCGQKQREIALDMELNEGRLSIIINSPLFKIELAKLERAVNKRAIEHVGDVTARIASLQGPAVSVLEKILINKDGKASLVLQKATAIDTLELAGAKRRDNDEGMNDFAQFVSDAYAEAQARRREMLEQEILAAEEGEVHTYTQLRLVGASSTRTSDVDSERDISGEPVAVDDEEDIALASFDTEEVLTVLEQGREKEQVEAGEKENTQSPSALAESLHPTPADSTAVEVHSLLLSVLNSGATPGKLQLNADEIRELLKD